MDPRDLRRAAAPALISALAVACTVGGDVLELPPRGLSEQDAGMPFVCEGPDSRACDGSVHLSCEPVEAGEFYDLRRVDCGAVGMQCVPETGCLPCFPGVLRCQPCGFDDVDCNPEVAQRCGIDGGGWDSLATCEPADGEGCLQGRCVDLCEQAEIERSYEGCVFYAADLDNAAIDVFNDASAQQYAVVVANPFQVPVGVTVEQNAAPVGAPLRLEVVDQRDVPPGGLETFKLPRREVDGSTPLGLNDGTHTALSSNAYRITSTHPITAYQFNPLDNVNVFSNDASLLLPTSALSGQYTVVGWPQTIGDSDNPEDDFDPTASDEDLRAFLTIIGTEFETQVTIRLGPYVGRVLPGDGIPEARGGDELDLLIGPFDVINLESDGKDGDFTGTFVTTTSPVAVFTGSEASDVPSFATYAERRCCADHLEEQLFPDATLGTTFTIARMPPRTRALLEAGSPDDPLSIAVVDEREWVRIVAAAPGVTQIATSLPPPDDTIELLEREDAMLEATRDFTIVATQPIAVLQALPSQAQTGIPRQFPGGDPAIIAVPPAEQYRSQYIFLTPDKYAFDFVTIVADAGTRIELDGAPLSFYGCEIAPADGLAFRIGEPPVGQVIHRCQLSFPEVSSGQSAQTLPGRQDDGRHVLRADAEVGVIVYGFDRYVSYAYAAGLDLMSLQ